MYLITQRLYDADIYVAMCQHCADPLSMLSYLIHKMRHFVRNFTAPAIPFLVIYTKELKVGSQRDICSPTIFSPDEISVSSHLTAAMVLCLAFLTTAFSDT